MNRKKLLQSKSKGSAMALMMVALIVLFLIGMGLLSLGLQGRILALQDASEVAARCAADAGLTKALFEMNEKLEVKPWDDSTLPQTTNEVLPNCDATFSYTISGDSNGVYSIESTGDYGRAQRKVRSTLRLKSVFDYGIFVNGVMDLKNGTTIDAYNLDAGETLRIGTNSTDAGVISAKLGVTIDGDVVVGSGGDPSVVVDSIDEAVITGDVYSSDEFVLSSVIVPQYLQDLTSLGTLIGGTTVTASAKYDSINVGNGEVITVDGPVVLYVIGDIILDNSAQILIVDPNTNPNASLTLYLGGNIECKNGGTINNTSSDPQKLTIYGLDTSTSIVFKTNSIFYGAIYAPNADVQLNAYVEYFGSCIAKSFLQSVNANFHYDASLKNVSANDEGVRFVIKRWSE